MLEAGLLKGDALTVTAAASPKEGVRRKETPGQEVVRAKNNPLKSTGGLVILHAICRRKAASSRSPGTTRKPSAAPRAFSMAKKPRLPRSTIAKIKAGDVVVIRYEGPRGGPGMRECSRSPRP